MSRVTKRVDAGEWGEGVEYGTAGHRLPDPAFADHVRAHPEVYFGVGRESPELPTEVLQRVVQDALHHPGGTHGECVVEILSDLSFTVEDDRPHPADARRRPRPGFHGSLLDPDRPAPAAAAALCVRTVVEVWLDGRGLRQELAGTVPAGPPRECPALRRHGTRTTFHLDPAYTGADEAVAWALRPEELHAQPCGAHPPPVVFRVRDLRPGADGRP
ncbi:hypothetical protein ACWENO_28215 [Streptomyces sp. NPDC004436]